MRESVCREMPVNVTDELVSVPATPGGKVAALNVPLNDMDLLDFDGHSRFLTAGRDAQGKLGLWSGCVAETFSRPNRTNSL